MNKTTVIVLYTIFLLMFPYIVEAILVAPFLPVVAFGRPLPNLPAQ